MSLIQNTWRTDFDAWYRELQAERQNDIKRGVYKTELNKNWGHINFHFALHFFELLGKLRDENPELYSEFCAKANETLYFWNFNEEPRSIS